MPLDQTSRDNYSDSEDDDCSDSDAEQRNEERPSCEQRTSVAAPFASSVGLPLADTSDDDQKPAAKEHALSGGVESAAATSTTHFSSSTPPPPAKGQAASKKRRSQENEYRFSFREPFLEKLRLMLDNETNANSGSIQWLDEEDAFVILDQNMFEKDVIPKYFTPIIFQSFLRKLYRWGFKRITTTHAGRYKFASATFKRSTPPSTALTGAEGTTNISVDPVRHVPFSAAPVNNVLEMLQSYAQLNQQPAANAQPNHQTHVSLLAQLQQSMQAQLQQSVQPAATQDNNLNSLSAALANAIAQQSLPQAIQLQQQINQNQAASILQSLLAQLVNQSILQGATSRVFTPAPGPDLMIGSLGATSQAPLASYLNQNPLLNAYAATLRAGPSPEQTLSLLMSNIQNATTAAGGTDQDTGSARVITETSSSAGTDDSRRTFPHSQSDSSSTPPPQRKRKQPHPPS